MKTRKRTIKVELSVEGIDHALKELDKFERHLLDACDKLIDQLSDLGVETARMYLYVETDGWTQHLEDSIHKEPVDKRYHVGRVRTDCPYAAFVEFGTGIRGAIGAAVTEDTFPRYGYKPDGMGHGFEGWWYFNPNDGKVHWTQGEPPKPFMYTAYMRVRSEAGKVAETTFIRL